MSLPPGADEREILMSRIQVKDIRDSEVRVEVENEVKRSGKVRREERPREGKEVKSRQKMTKCSRRLLSSCDLFRIQSLRTSGETAYLLHGSNHTLADGGDAELFGLR